MILSVLTRVFRHIRYGLLAGGVAFTVVSATLLLPNRVAIIQVLSADSVGVGVKLSFIVGIFGSLKTNFTVLSASYLIIVAVMFGVNIALLTFYIRRRQEVAQNTGAHLASIGGVVSAALGIGCAACGSIVLTYVLGLFGAGSFMLLLPLRGLEFGVIGIILLGFSIHYLIKKINDPLVCPVNL